MLGDAACGGSVAEKRLRHVDSGVKILANSGAAEEVFTTEVRGERTSGLVKSKAEGSPPASKTLRMAAMAAVSGVSGFSRTLMMSGEGGSLTTAGLDGGND